MIGQPQNLLKKSGPEGVRRLLLQLVKSAAAAAQRMRDPLDGEALHDFRVILRRLRTILGFYKPLAKGVSRKRRRQLREFLKLTNDGRDAQVQVAWLARQRPELTARQRVGCRWLEEQVTGRAGAGADPLRDAIPRRFARLAEKLSRRLARPATRGLASAPVSPGFAAVTAGLLRKAAEQLRKSLAAMEHPHDERAMHKARIAVKRLRYLLEPLQGGFAPARPLAGQLKKMQDQLGEMHDLQLLDARLLSALETAAAARSRKLHELSVHEAPDAPALRRLRGRSEQSGLLELARRARLRLASLYRGFEAAAAAGGHAALQAQLQDAAARLASFAVPVPAHPVEIPELPGDAAVVH